MKNRIHQIGSFAILVGAILMITLSSLRAQTYTWADNAQGQVYLACLIVTAAPNLLLLLPVQLSLVPVRPNEQWLQRTGNSDGSNRAIGTRPRPRDFIPVVQGPSVWMWSLARQPILYWMNP